MDLRRKHQDIQSQSTIAAQHSSATDPAVLVPQTLEERCSKTTCACSNTGKMLKILWPFYLFFFGFFMVKELRQRFIKEVKGAGGYEVRGEGYRLVM